MEITVWSVLFLASLTAVATGLGALPFLVVRNVTEGRLGMANALAAGLMLSASLILVLEGWDHSATLTILGVLAGAGAVWLAQVMLHDHEEEMSVGALRGADARKALMIMGVMTAHSFAEGIGVGVSYGGGDELVQAHDRIAGLRGGRLREGGEQREGGASAGERVADVGGVADVRGHDGSPSMVRTSPRRPLRASPARRLARTSRRRRSRAISRPASLPTSWSAVVSESAAEGSDAS